MLEILKSLTPPEWPGWHWLARLTYVVVFVGLMIPVIWFARIFGDWVGNTLFPS